MRRSLFFVLTALAVFIAACGMQRPSRIVTPVSNTAMPTVVPSISDTATPAVATPISSIRTPATVSPLSTPTLRPSPSPGLGTVAATLSPTPSIAATAAITRTATPAGAGSPTRTGTATPSPTLSPTRIGTPLPTSTTVVRPTSTPVATLAPAFTSTPRPTFTPVPPTPTIPPFPFVVENSFGAPDCSKTEIWGYLIDRSRQGLGGYRVKVGNVNGAWSTESGTTGGDGKYSVRLSLAPTAGRWFVVVIDGAGKELSPRVQVETTTSNCGPDQSGIQVARVDFRKDY